MPIVDREGWEKCQKNNTDPYGNAVIMVARKAMEILDSEPGDFDPHKLLCRADDESCAGGITGFMAGCAASIISGAHSRGEEFRRKWNTHCQIGNEGDKANESGGVLNPAILSIG